MTQAQRIAEELSHLVEDLCTILEEDRSDLADGSRSDCTVVHTLGRIFALDKELHSLFDITLIESSEYRGGGV